MTKKVRDGGGKTTKGNAEKEGKQKPIGRKLLVDRREAADLTQGELAAKLGFSAFSYSRLERGETEMSAHELQVLAAFYRCTMEELVDGAPQQKIYPGRWIDVFTIEGRMLTKTEQKLHIDNQPHSVYAFAVLAPDNSMAPKIMKGDKIVIDPALKPIPGAVVLAKAPGTGDHVLRLYTPLYSNDKRAPGFILRPENVDYPEIIATRSSPGEIMGVAVSRATGLFPLD